MTVPSAPRSVNWTTGMLLTPEHFQAQDAYVDASVGWLLRYCVGGAGLVGGGVRLGDAERGMAAHDPRVEVADDGEIVRVAVSAARGITPAGKPVELGDGHVARGEFRRGALEGVQEVWIYVVREGSREQDPASEKADLSNPNQAMLLRPSYRVELGAGADVEPHAVAVGRLRRASATLAFELDGRVIPPCVTVLAHSEMHAGWLSLRNEVVRLAGSYAELHRAAARFATHLESRAIDTRDDREILAFVERTVLALDGCAYAILDPSIPPGLLFGEVERAARRVAISLDLSGATQHFFHTLSEADAGYAGLLEEERRALTRGREAQSRSELRPALERAEQTLARLRRLGEALEGKYVDYRVNRSLGSLRFLLDRGGEHFYIAVATPGYPSRDGDLTTFVFSNMSLTGRHEYRVVLLGDPQEISDWQPGEELRVDLRINVASGAAHPVSRVIACEMPGQRNFAVNFDAPPDLATLTGLQVTVQPGYRVRGAVLYQRRLGLASEAMAAANTDVAPRVAESQPSPALARVADPPVQAGTTGPRIRIRKP